MADEDVDVNVTAHSFGEEVYGQHEKGIQRVGDAAEKTGEKVAGSAGRFEGASAAIRGLNLTLLSAERGMRLFGISNDTVTAAIDGLITILTIARAALALHRAVTESVTLANWARAASEVAASNIFAPIVVGIIIAALAGLSAYALFGRTSTAAGGIDVVATGPRLILAGEAGPERVRVDPITGTAQTGFSIGAVHITVVTSDPQAAGRAVADELIRLKQAGR